MLPDTSTEEVVVAEIGPDTEADVKTEVIEIQKIETQIDNKQDDWSFQAAEAISSDPVFVDAASTYLNWYYTAPIAYQHLIESGRSVCYEGDTKYPASDEYKKAALIAYGAYKVQAYVRLSGFPRSPYIIYENALNLVRTCMNREFPREYEACLIIAGLESTYGLGSSNHFGILDKRFAGYGVEGYCDYLDYWQMKTFGYLSNDLYDIARVYNDHQPWRDNLYEAVNGLKGEKY